MSEFALEFEFPRTEIVPSEQPHQPRIAKPYLLLWVVVFTHPDAPKNVEAQMESVPVLHVF